jgi:hypothetical protein
MSEDMMGARAVGAGQGWTWIADGFGLFKKALGIWIALMVVLIVIMVAFRLVPFVGEIATVLLLPAFTGGLMLGCETLQRGGSLELSHLFAGFKEHAGNLIALGALAIVALFIALIPFFVIVGVGVVAGMMKGDTAGAVAMGGSFMLATLVFLALIIPVSMALWFAPALVVLRGLAPVAAIKESFLGCLKNIIPFLIYGVVMLVLSLLATLPLLLGWLVLGPVATASVYTAYRDIFGDA